jgi:hypothetical protein
VKKQLRDEWVKALRSGEYEQGTGTLKYEEKFCCLGVLCAVHFGRDFSGYEPTRFAYGSGKSEIRERDAEALWQMNDLEKKQFPAIADWIEANVPVES